MCNMHMHEYDCMCMNAGVCVCTSSVTAPEEKCPNLSGCQVIPESVITLEKKVS